MQIQDMDLNTSFLTKNIWASANFQNCLSGKDMMRRMVGHSSQGLVKLSKGYDFHCQKFFEVFILHHLLIA